MSIVMLWTVVETTAYLKKAERIFTVDELADIVWMLATDPEQGDIVVGTGGVRKLKIARGSRGKSAGARVVYYFHGDARLPVLVFTVFTKTEKDNLGNEEKKELAKMVEAIKDRLKRMK